MIPSDHFVRFYNEVFKFLDTKNGLEDYYLHISKHQEHHCLKIFSENGIAGVYEYYVKIRKEENCEMDLELNEDFLFLGMTGCPSLSKNLDNDAGLCIKYCEHCPGWSLPLTKKAGLKVITDIMAPDEPQCCTYYFEDLAKAEKKYQELLETIPADRLRKNF